MLRRHAASNRGAPIWEVLQPWRFSIRGRFSSRDNDDDGATLQGREESIRRGCGCTADPTAGTLSVRSGMHPKAEISAEGDQSARFLIIFVKEYVVRNDTSGET